MSTIGTVFVVDDDQDVLKSLKWLVESVNLDVRVYNDCLSFLNEYQCEKPHCLVLDVRMPMMSGLELQEQLQVRNIQIPIIFITGHGDIPMAVRAMKNGAMEFTTKPVNHQHLLELINQALDISQIQLLKRSQAQSTKDKIVSLTKREHEVFELLTEGCSTKTIADKLSISQNTVELHRSKVMKKMEVRSVAALIRELFLNDLM